MSTIDTTNTPDSDGDTGQGPHIPWHLAADEDHDYLMEARWDDERRGLTDRADY